ncbi:MAG: PglZ domain-containing protein [Syntrophomonadaceae bacterium]|nr:PglZ domain-containing protein [Syntrophomonadaceae bacterium]
MKDWFEPLFEKLKQSYSPYITVYDPDHLADSQTFMSVLQQDFAIIKYQGELSLRQYIRQHPDRQVVILLQQDNLFLPYDIERSAAIITWRLSDIFPRLASNAMKQFKQEGYQSIYDTYQADEDILGILDEQQTLSLITEWIRQGKVIAHEKGYRRSGVLQSSKLDNFQETGSGEYRSSQIINEILEMLKEETVSWFNIAKLWCELESLHPGEMLLAESYYVLDRELNQRFQTFIVNEYKDLFFASYKNNPVTINQTMNFLGTLSDERIALLCFDGMGFPEWYYLRKYLRANGLWNFQEQATFALIPTLTWSSRTSLFTGEIFLDKMDTESTGFNKAVNKYIPNGKTKTRKLFKNKNGRWNSEYLNYDILGVVFRLIDEVGHNSVLLSNSKRNMHLQLNMLYEQTQIAYIISALITEGYRVFISADHGSVWCHGNGIKVEKYLVEDRALRVLRYPNIKLAEEFATPKGLLLYQNPQILGEKVLVFPKGREMFCNKEHICISHGGIHIEELIIPFVEVLP